jgi:histidinol-phosphate aminotransferase
MSHDPFSEHEARQQAAPADSAASALVNPYLDLVKPYIPGLTSEEASRRYHIPPDRLIKLSSNENPLGPPPLAAQAAQRMLANLHRYPDSRAQALRHKIAEIEGLSADHVIIGAGSSEIMSLIVRAFSGPGQDVLSMDPSFTVYSEIAAADGRNPALVPLRHPFDLAPQELLSLVSSNTRIIFITRPNNPTSRLIPIADFENIARTVSSAIVVSDEAYIEFADDYRQQTAASLIRILGNVIVTRTFSKVFGIPNLRVGYALGPPDAIAYLFRLKPKWNVGEVAQQAAIGALEDHEHFSKTLSVVRDGRAFLVKELARIEGLEVVPEPQANFVMVRVRETGYSAEGLTERLGFEGILIRGDFHPEYIRISVGTETDNQSLVRALHKVLDGR